ncbi:unnamed protein product [Rotaria sp. Silwood2]|nr:unnamed protein product [Rotaria sp. Silwood2]CAF3025616.1 unnamed protein product [Rotaria sp. Silwood2]CAF4178652.1 unnamed protein product [Rotaria sp. Silwood2]
MDNRYFIIIDATLESQAPFFAQNPIFQTWLRAFNNVAEALQFITEIRLPYSITVYLARDNILDDGLPSDINGQIRTILHTLNDLQTIHLVTIFTPNKTSNLLQQIRAIISNPRLIKDVISVIDFRAYMCLEGENYLQQEITRCTTTNEEHLIPNLSQNINDLREYLEKIKNDRRKILENMIEQHSNKPGEEEK